MPTFSFRARARYWWGFLEALGLVLTTTLAAQGLTWRRVTHALLVLLVWAALALAALTALVRLTREVLHGA